MIEEELAYIAGFWEGEGHAGIYSAGRSVPKKLTVGISQKNLQILLEIRNLFDYGHICRPRDGVYEWRVRGKKAKDFLRHIYPFTKFRHKQVRALMI